MAILMGAHAIIYSRKPEADRAFLRDVLALPHVDIGDGWLVFGLPPSELAVHPFTKNNVHVLYFMCKDMGAFMETMKRKGVSCSAVQTLSWGKRTQVRLPGGGRLGVYQPLHARPKAARPRKQAAPRTSRSRTKS
jgi:hypothetical protein